jgi:hypothetical protein
MMPAPVRVFRLRILTMADLRDKSLAALIVTIAALTAGAQLLAPAPAVGMIDLGNGCSLDDWGSVTCDETGGGSGGPAGSAGGGDSGYWEEGPGSAAGSNTGGGDAPSNVEGGNGYDTAGPDSAPAQTHGQSQTSHMQIDSWWKSVMGSMRRAWRRQECRRVGHGIRQRIRAHYGDDASFDRVVNSGDRGLDHLQGLWEGLGCGSP